MPPRGLAVISTLHSFRGVHWLPRPRSRCSSRPGSAPRPFHAQFDSRWQHLLHKMCCLQNPRRLPGAVLPSLWPRVQEAGISFTLEEREQITCRSDPVKERKEGGHLRGTVSHHNAVVRIGPPDGESASGSCLREGPPPHRAAAAPVPFSTVSHWSVTGREQPVNAQPG